MTRLFAILSAALIALAASAGASDLGRTLAEVVDSREWPEAAAAIETRPYRALLDRVRTGPDEHTMRWRLAERFPTARQILADPEDFRGEIVPVAGAIVVEIAIDMDAPGVGRFDRYEVHRGIAGRISAATGAIELWAFRILRAPNEPRIYPGDRVHISGYFLKNTPVVDARGAVHWMPLLVGPWPTYYGKWAPIGLTLRMAGLEGLLPTSPHPDDGAERRPVVVFDGDGRMFLDGAEADAGRVRRELARHASARPGRAAVAVVAERAASDLALRLAEDAGLARLEVKVAGAR